jgi:hypothetical protein
MISEPATERSASETLAALRLQFPNFHQCRSSVSAVSSVVPLSVQGPEM